MKKVMYLLVLAFFAMSCENSNLLEPTNNDLPTYEKQNISAGDIIKDVIKNKNPNGKSYKHLALRSKYYFNPKDRDHDCGGYLDRKPAKYQYETSTERYLKNLRIYCPSSLQVGNKTYKTFNVYTINRHELLSPKGMVLQGTTWGTVTVVLKKEADPKKDKWIDEVENLTEENLSQNPVHKKFGPVLFKANFNGVIKSNKTEIKLKGSGFNQFAKGNLTAVEKIVCAGSFCWKSDITGNVRVLEFRDE